RKMPEFQHDGRCGSFRVWLRLIAVNRLRDFWRVRAARPMTPADSDFARQLDQLEDPHSDLGRQWDLEHDRHVLARLLELIEPELQPPTWQAFRLHVLDGQPADAVADGLGVSTNVVFISKSRVLARLREEAGDLIDESSLP